MNKALILVLSVLVSVSMGCVEHPEETDEVTAVQVTAVPIVEQPKPDVSAIMNNAVELREERLYLVTLKFKKDEFTLDLGTVLANEASAEQRTVIVGEQTFNQYEVGKTISSKEDVWGFADYTITPVEKNVNSQFFWADHNGSQKEISREEYDLAVGQLRASGRELLTVPYAGVVRTSVLEKPLSEYQFVSRQPLYRYFIKVEVKSETLTLDLIKSLRNEANAHQIIIEVPKEIFDKTGDFWEPQMSTGSFFFKGHISELRGRIIEKWSSVDEKYILAETADGQQFIVPK